MATCPLTTVADAIAAQIATGHAADAFGVGLEFTPRVLWADRQVELEERETLRVDVAPVGFERELFTRGKVRFTLRYHIGVRKKFGSHEQSDDTGLPADDQVQELVDLANDLCDYFTPQAPDHQGRPLADASTAAWKEEPEETTQVTIDWAMLEQLHQFTAYFPITFQVTQETGT